MAKSDVWSRRHEFNDLKRAFVELAHAVGPMIPEGSELEGMVYQFGKELDTPESRYMAGRFKKAESGGKSGGKPEGKRATSKLFSHTPGEGEQRPQPAPGSTPGPASKVICIKLMPYLGTTITFKVVENEKDE